ncbi:glycosyltransferase family 90 protein [Microdochium bolleyi]|uniref:Glycosyltransferase family 90 protein n=1 Tax=Microdochium bolleyi TaxID=196109 RepID=A0A136IWI0_9PEZI|nr:glycosyltransferase family 90 protein [Microdochium bolleyi]
MLAKKPSWLREPSPPGIRWPRFNWRSRLHSSLAFCVFSLLVCGYWLFAPADITPFANPTTFEDYLQYNNGAHPIDELIRDAHDQHRRVLRDASPDLDTAAARYRERRGRHPPPGFDAWFKYAQDHNATVIESFFDRIEKDIAPYWALDPEQTALRASTWLNTVRVRNGVAKGVGPIKKWAPPWQQLWTDLIDEAGPYLPDVDMPFNYLDESRLLVPWDVMEGLMRIERDGRSMKDPKQVTSEYSGLHAVDSARGQIQMYEPKWLTKNFWDAVRATCPPKSASRNVKQFGALWERPEFPDRDQHFQHKGYVRNFTATMDVCTQPHMRGLHAAMIEPGAMLTSDELIPLFGGCKLMSNNEILIPGAMYLADSARFRVTGTPKYSIANSWSVPWNKKQDRAVWRGLSSGGNTTEENWTHLQRMRAVEMFDGSVVADAEASGVPGKTFDLPSSARYPHLMKARGGNLGSWIKDLSDVGFTQLTCLDGTDEQCGYMRETFPKASQISFSKYFDYKFLPDIDGNSFSGRFRSFLQSTSLPIKSTIYAEWHDDRLRPWLHFVPMDNTQQDLYGILDYFTGDSKGDKAAQLIAEQGAVWAAQVLRREDMLLYTWRVLLEWARVCDLKRHDLGFVGDLLS